MISFLPKQIADKGLLVYIISVAIVSIVFMSHAMGIEYMAIGLACVAGFFYLSSSFTRKWGSVPEKKYIKVLLISALSIRVLWVIFSYCFYIAKTGQPFEFEAADAMGYHELAEWLSGCKWSMVNDYIFNQMAISDAGYPIYLIALYKIIGPNIFVTRLLKAVLGAATCYLIYRVSSRNIGEEAARMAGFFAAFMPNLVIYCGLHVKETEMLFLIALYIERADYLLRVRKYNVFTIAIPILLAASLFLYRTVLGAVAVLSFVTSLVCSSTQIVGKAKRAMLIGWAIFAVAVLAGSTIATEVQGYWENRGDNQSRKRSEQVERGNKWAKYATGSVMAPMMFVVPFSTMVSTEGQENQLVMHGGNYVRNFIGIFVLIALFNAIFKNKNWRDLSLLGSFDIGYLAVIAMSGFSNSERFVLPALPCLLVFAAAGLSQLNAKSYKFVKYWYVIVVVMEFGWAFFKIGSRGLF